MIDFLKIIQILFTTYDFGIYSFVFASPLGDF